ncbi:MAG: shikimate dehydrogenase family protein [Bacteroidia bacterium]
METYGLIGYPLTHSFSEKFFTEKFRNENIRNCEYKNFPLTSIELLTSLIESNEDIRGLNVTTPYKQSALRFLNYLDPVAEKTKSVNTIKVIRKNKKVSLEGYNSDVYGFEKSFLAVCKPHHKNAIILGTGGAAQAVSYVLASLKIQHSFVSRTQVHDNIISYSSLDKEKILQATVIINATPAGMFPQINDCPQIPFQYVTPDHLLFDLIYNPGETLFLKKGKEKGAQIKNGLEMLHLQAEKAWEIWQGK